MAKVTINGQEIWEVEVTAIFHVAGDSPQDAEDHISEHLQNAEYPIDISVQEIAAVADTTVDEDDEDED